MTKQAEFTVNKLPWVFFKGRKAVLKFSNTLYSIYVYIFILHFHTSTQMNLPSPGDKEHLFPSNFFEMPIKHKNNSSKIGPSIFIVIFIVLAKL